MLDIARLLQNDLSLGGIAQIDLKSGKEHLGILVGIHEKYLKLRKVNGQEVTILLENIAAWENLGEGDSQSEPLIETTFAAEDYGGRTCQDSF